MDFKQMFSDEIRRLARKEIKVAMIPFVETIAALKKQIAEQKKQIAILEKRACSAAVCVPASVDEDDAEDSKSVRINAAGIVRLRTKLGLTQAEFARAIGVAMHTVSVWEQGRRVPRKAQKIRICALRKVGKRELKRRLAEAVDIIDDNEE